MAGSWSTTATMGTLVDNGDGTALFTPASGESGTVTLTFEAGDPDGTGPVPAARLTR